MMKLTAYYIQGACYNFKWNFFVFCVLPKNTYTIHIKNYNSAYCFIWM